MTRPENIVHDAQLMGPVQCVPCESVVPGNLEHVRCVLAGEWFAAIFVVRVNNLPFEVVVELARGERRTAVIHARCRSDAAATKTPHIVRTQLRT